MKLIRDAREEAVRAPGLTGCGSLEAALRAWLLLSAQGAPARGVGAGVEVGVVAKRGADTGPFRCCFEKIPKERRASKGDRPSAGAQAGVAAGALRSGHIRESSGFPEGPDERKQSRTTPDLWAHQLRDGEPAEEQVLHRKQGIPYWICWVLRCLSGD